MEDHLLYNRYTKRLLLPPRIFLIHDNHTVRTDTPFDRA